jgi:hypothetical protein
MAARHSTPRFPGWAPPILRPLYQMYSARPGKLDAGDGLSNREHASILNKLLTHRKMSDVWRALEKRASDPQGPWRAMKEDIALAFNQPFFLPATGELLMAAYSQGQQGSWTPVVEGVNDVNRTFQLVLEDIHAVHFHVIVCKALYWPEEARKTPAQMCAQGLAIAERALELAARVEQFFPLRNRPGINVADFLRGLAASAEEQVAAIENNGVIVAKPRGKNAKFNYFCRVLTGSIEERYGTPLWDVVKTTAQVMFNDDTITALRVRHAVER